MPCRRHARFRANGCSFGRVSTARGVSRRKLLFLPDTPRHVSVMVASRCWIRRACQESAFGWQKLPIRLGWLLAGRRIPRAEPWPRRCAWWPALGSPAGRRRGGRARRTWGPLPGRSRPGGHAAAWPALCSGAACRQRLLGRVRRALGRRRSAPRGCRHGCGRDRWCGCCRTTTARLRRNTRGG